MPDRHRPAIRAAIVGAGLMGRWHADALMRAGGRLIAVQDCRADAAERLARTGGARAFTSLEELLDQTQLDVLHICAPLETHFELAMISLNANAHVLIEKPLAPNAGDTARLLELARARGRYLVPVHQFIFQDGVTRALARLPTLAPLVHLEANVATAGGIDRDVNARDQLVTEILPHPLALFQRFARTDVDQVEWLVSHPAPGELRAIGQAQRISLAINISANSRPTRNSFSILGEQGSAHLDLFHGYAVFEKGVVSRVQKILHPFDLAARTFTAASVNLAARAWRNEAAYPGLRELIRTFYAAIRTGAAPPINPQEILSGARARDQLTSKFSSLTPN